jgi:hypothetical protein
MWGSPTDAIGSSEVLVPATLALADVYLAIGEARSQRLIPTQDPVLGVAYVADNPIHRATVDERATDVKRLVLVTVDLPHRGSSVTRRGV